MKADFRFSRLESTRYATSALIESVRRWEVRPRIGWILVIPDVVSCWCALYRALRRTLHPTFIRSTD